MKLYLVRHGESEHNVDRSRMAHTHDSNHALTQLGQKQVRQTANYMGQHLHGNNIIFTSPYLRTMETAMAIQSMLPKGTPFHQNLLIREWELGNLYDVENRTPEAKKEFKAAGQLYFRFHNGESLADVYQRAALFMHTKVHPLAAHGRFDNVILVTHAAFIHMMLAFLMDWPVEDLQGFQPVENAGVIAVTENSDGYTFEKLFVPSTP